MSKATDTDMTTPWNSTSVDVDVLVVDDDQDIRSTWSEILQNVGYSVAIAADGDVALRVLGERDAGLVLLDLHMPRQDGWSVLGALGAKQLVMFVSAYSLDDATRVRTEAKVVTFLESPSNQSAWWTSWPARWGSPRDTEWMS